MNSSASMGVLPNPTQEMVPFWEGLARGEFLLLRCEICGAWRWPMAGCREHPNGPFLDNLSWKPASGRGRILTCVVHHAQIDPAFPVPYVYAAIELDEGPVLVSNVVNCAPGAVSIGMRVRVVLRRVDEHVVLPLFEPGT